MSGGCRLTLLLLLALAVAIFNSANCFAISGLEQLPSGANSPPSSSIRQGSGDLDAENLNVGSSFGRRSLQTDDSGCLPAFQSTTDLLTCTKQLIDDSIDRASNVFDVAVLPAASAASAAASAAAASAAAAAAAEEEEEEEGGDAIFFVLNGTVWRRNASTTTTSARSGSRWQSSQATPIFGPWPNSDPDLLGGRQELGSLAILDVINDDVHGNNETSKKKRKVMFVVDASNRVLRRFSIDGLKPDIQDSSNFTNDTSGRLMISLAGYSRGGVLYASNERALYRMNLSGIDPSSIGRPKVWLGSPGKSASVDSDVPDLVRFRRPYLSTSAISGDGEAMYVVEPDVHVLRRVLIRSRAVETVAGAPGQRGDADGHASEARFNEPIGQALMGDGCSLFVGEMLNGQRGRIRLVSFQGMGGAYVRTVANLSVPVIRLAMHPNDELLYAATGAGSVFEISVNRSLLPKCDLRPLPPDKKKTGVSRTAAIALAVSLPMLVVLLLAVGALVAVKTRGGPGCDWAWGWRPWRRVGGGGSGRKEDGGDHGGRQPGREEEAAPLRLPAVDDGSESGFGASGSSWNPSSAFPGTWGDRSGSKSGVRNPGLQPSGPRRFSLGELAAACDGFKSSNLVGKGGAAEVFRGVLPDGQVVALKVMRAGDFTRGRLQQFQAELDFLGLVRHSHVLSIIGFCAEGGKAVIVYPFVGGGSLYDRLHPHLTLASSTTNQGDGVIGDMEGKLSLSDGQQTLGRGSGCNSTSCPWEPSGPAWKPLTWRERLSIALQIGKALQFLHEELDPPVVHRDIKSNNILLEGGGSSALRAYLADFGLVRQGKSVFGAEKAGETVETYHVAGTIGYMAPEYYTYCRLTAKNDVYAFGVVLLELITGCKAFGTPPDYRTKGEGGYQVEEKVEEGEDLVPTEKEKEKEKEKKPPQTMAKWVRKMVEDMMAPMASEEEGKRRTREATLKLEVVQKIADKRMEMCGDADWLAVSNMLALAITCIIEKPAQRPGIGSVVEELAQLEGSKSFL